MSELHNPGPFAEFNGSPEEYSQALATYRAELATQAGTDPETLHILGANALAEA